MNDLDGFSPWRVDFFELDISWPFYLKFDVLTKMVSIDTQDQIGLIHMGIEDCIN